MKRWLFYYVDDLSDQITGGGRSVRNLILGVRENRGIDPVFVSQREGKLARQLDDEGVPVCTVSLPDLLDVYDKEALEYSLGDKARCAPALVRYNRKISALVQEYGADGIWARGTRGVLQTGGAAWWEGIPLVWDIGVEQRPQGVIWLLHALCLFLSDRVVTQAEAQPDVVFGPLRSIVDSSKFRAIHPGIATARVFQLREAASQSGYEGAHLIGVGSIHPRKNQLMTLRAFAQSNRTHPGARLDLVGAVKDDEYFHALKRFVGRNGLDDSVRFLGWRDDVPTLLGRSDGLVLSSTREGVPHVVREAMFAEVPVIATAVGGIPEAVHDGETGFLVSPDRITELKERIDYLLSNPEDRKRMGRKGLQLARRRFSREAWLSEYTDLLHEVSGDNSR